MKKINTAAQMRQMDYEAMHGSYAIAPAVLMENAGRAVPERAEKWIEGWDGKDVVLFCGKGNNGGDGFVIARYILAAGARAYVYILGQEADYSDEARQHLHTLQELADDETCLLHRHRPHEEIFFVADCTQYTSLNTADTLGQAIHLIAIV